MIPCRMVPPAAAVLQSYPPASPSSPFVSFYFWAITTSTNTMDQNTNEATATIYMWPVLQNIYTLNGEQEERCCWNRGFPGAAWHDLCSQLLLHLLASVPPLTRDGIFRGASSYTGISFVDVFRTLKKST